MKRRRTVLTYFAYSLSALLQVCRGAWNLTILAPDHFRLAEDVSPLIVFATAIPCTATNLTAEREQYYSVAG